MISQEILDQCLALAQTISYVWTSARNQRTFLNYNGGTEMSNCSSRSNEKSHNPHQHSSDVISTHTSLQIWSAYRPLLYHKIKLWRLIFSRQEIDKPKGRVKLQLDSSQYSGLPSKRPKSKQY